MVSPNLRSRYTQAFLFAVLLGVLFGMVRAAAAPAPVAVSTPALQQECESGSEQCHLIIWTPTICQVLEPWSYWWYAFFCDQRTSSMSSVTYDYAVDGSVTVTTVGEDEHGHKVTRTKRFTPRAK